MTSTHSAAAFTPDTVTLAVRTALARVLKRGIDEIQPDSRLEHDLGLDSLMLIHATIAIEEEVRVAVPANTAPDGALVTVADLIRFVHRTIDREVPSC